MTISDYGFTAEPFVKIFYLSVLLTVILAAVGILLYAVRSVGLYKMAKKLNLKNPEFSFIPYAKDNISGNIASEKDGSAMGKVFVVLSVITTAVTVAFLALYGAACINILFAADAAMAENIEPKDFNITQLNSVMSIAIVLIVLNLIKKIYATVVYYKIYKKFDSKNAVVYTVFGFILSVLNVFFIQSASKNSINNDDSMILKINNEIH